MEFTDQKSPGKVQRGMDAISQIEKTADTAQTAQIEFLMNADLSYALKGNDTGNSNETMGEESSDNDKQVCFVCKSDKTSIEGTKLLNCAKCRVAIYCSKACQIMDWKAGHKFDCQAYQRAGNDTTFKHINHKREAIVNGVLARIRFYSGPFAVHHHNRQGRGFLFLQSPCTLIEMSFLKPVSSSGKTIPERNIVMHFLALGEFDKELCRDGFELTLFRDKLQQAVHSYNPKSEVVVLLRFRCGHVALLRAPLVPDHSICIKLGEDYEGKPGAIQLQIDNQ